MASLRIPGTYPQVPSRETPSGPPLFLVRPLAAALVAQAKAAVLPADRRAAADALADLLLDVEPLLRPAAVRPVADLAGQLLAAG